MNAKFELQEIEQNEITVAFNNPQGIQSIINNIKSQVDEQIDGVIWDFTKEKDRKLVASLAYKVGRSKTAIDAEGKKLKEQYTVFTKAIDADRKLAREQLEAEQERIRKPLDEWEQAEKDRVEKHKADIEKIQDYTHPAVIQDMTASRIAEQIRMLDVWEICPLFEEFEQQAKLAKLETLELLRKALVEREKYEAEQAELERLRLADLVRQQQERDAQIAREATEKAQREAEEKARFEAEKAQREKAESEQREARLLAEKEAAVLREEALKQKAIDDAKQAEIDKQQAIEAERMRIEIQLADQADAERKAQEAREADKAHKKTICGEALKGLTDLGVDPELGKEILRAINKGLVPHVSIKF